MTHPLPSLAAGLGLALAISALPAICLAQQTGAPATAASGEAAAEGPMAPAVGSATRNLLQQQREGEHASATPRPIDGEVAELSRQRLHKSYQQPLPQWFGSRVESPAR